MTMSNRALKILEKHLDITKDLTNEVKRLMDRVVLLENAVILIIEPIIEKHKEEIKEEKIKND